MNPLESGSGLLSSLQSGQAGIYTDLQGLQKIKQLNKGEDADSEAALRAVASQFESIFVSMMMKSMREANEAFKDKTMNNSSEMDFYQQMFDQQLALSLSNGGGTGMADALVRQLRTSLHKNEVQDAEPKDPFLDYRAAPVRPVIQRSAPESAKAGPVAAVTFSGPQDFAEKLMPLAAGSAQQLGVDARYLISQVALETGWGEHLIRDAQGRNSHNLFGIKAGGNWQGDVMWVDTLEYRDGLPVRERAAFRAYASYADSFADYVDFVSGQQRYSRALQNSADGAAYIRELQQAGYATDPDYADKIIRIVSGLYASTTPGDRG